MFCFGMVCFATHTEFWACFCVQHVKGRGKGGQGCASKQASACLKRWSCWCASLTPTCVSLTWVTKWLGFVLSISDADRGEQRSSARPFFEGFGGRRRLHALVPHLTQFVCPSKPWGLATVSVTPSLWPSAKLPTAQPLLQLPSSHTQTHLPQRTHTHTHAHQQQ